MTGALGSLTLIETLPCIAFVRFESARSMRPSLCAMCASTANGFVEPRDSPGAVEVRPLCRVRRIDGSSKQLCDLNHGAAAEHVDRYPTGRQVTAFDNTSMNVGLRTEGAVFGAKHGDLLWTRLR